MRVVIFENEFQEMEPFFKVFKLENNDFSYDVHVNSQGVKPFENVLKYDKILVDLKLSDKTHMEGFEIVQSVVELGYDIKNIAIITAHTDYKGTLRERNLEHIKVMEKPLGIDELEKFLFGTSAS